MRSQDTDVEMVHKYSNGSTIKVVRSKKPVEDSNQFDVNMLVQLEPSPHGGSNIPLNGMMNWEVPSPLHQYNHGGDQEKPVHSESYTSTEIKTSHQMSFIETTFP